jgi:hypothetical protein
VKPTDACAMGVLLSQRFFLPDAAAIMRKNPKRGSIEYRLAGADSLQGLLDQSGFSDPPPAGDLGKKPSVPAEHFRQDPKLISSSIKLPRFHSCFRQGKVKLLYLKEVKLFYLMRQTLWLSRGR